MEDFYDAYTSNDYEKISGIDMSYDYTTDLEENKSFMFLKHGDLDNIFEYYKLNKFTFDNIQEQLTFEYLICDNPEYSYTYSSKRKMRFRLGEPAIANIGDHLQGGNYAYLYASEVLNSRFELGEDLILNRACMEYALRYLKDYYPEGRRKFLKEFILYFNEHTFQKDEFGTENWLLIDYLENTRKFWTTKQKEEIENFISEKSHLSYRYARDVIGGRFELGEPMIATNAKLAYEYARDVIGDRFELAENNILKHRRYSDIYYNRFLDEINETTIF